MIRNFSGAIRVLNDNISIALIYYRAERIIEDIAVDCRQIFTQESSLEWRERGFYYLNSNFRPNSTIDLAFQKPGFLS